MRETVAEENFEEKIIFKKPDFTDIELKHFVQLRLFTEKIGVTLKGKDIAFIIRECSIMQSSSLLNLDDFFNSRMESLLDKSQWKKKKQGRTR